MKQNLRVLMFDGLQGGEKTNFESCMGELKNMRARKSENDAPNVRPQRRSGARCCNTRRAGMAVHTTSDTVPAPVRNAMWSSSTGLRNMSNAKGLANGIYKRTHVLHFRERGVYTRCHTRRRSSCSGCICRRLYDETSRGRMTSWSRRYTQGRRKGD